MISLQTYADPEVMERALSDKMGLNNTIFESEPPGMTKQDRLERWLNKIKYDEKDRIKLDQSSMWYPILPPIERLEDRIR